MNLEKWGEGCALVAFIMHQTRRSGKDDTFPDRRDRRDYAGHFTAGECTQISSIFVDDGV